MPLAERIIDELLAADPGLANTAGDHRYDDRLPDLSADGVAARVAMLRDASGALSGVDTDDLDEAERVDHEQLLLAGRADPVRADGDPRARVEPAGAQPGRAAARAGRPPVRAGGSSGCESLAARLAAVPDALATARALLADCPRDPPGDRRRPVSGHRGVRPARRARRCWPRPRRWRPLWSLSADAAAAALDDFSDWARDRAAAPEAGRDPRLGRRLWEAKLWHTLDTELTAAEVLRSAWQNLDRIGEEIRAAAVDLVGGRADDRHGAGGAEPTRRRASRIVSPLWS